MKHIILGIYIIFLKKKYLMQSKPTINESNAIQEETKNSLQTSQAEIQSMLINSNDQTIQKRVDLQLYLHFERMLSKQKYHSTRSSRFFGKKVSKQQIVNETVTYLNYLNQNITPFPPQHYQELLFLIDIFDRNNKLITNRYHFNISYRDSRVKFSLSFYEIKQRIDLKKFISFNNWNHLRFLSFFYCGWLDNDHWKALVQHAGNFNNLKVLNLRGNEISEIKYREIEHFKTCSEITLYNNPLSEQSLDMLEELRQKWIHMTIWFFKQ